MALACKQASTGATAVAGLHCPPGNLDCLVVAVCRISHLSGTQPVADTSQDPGLNVGCPWPCDGRITDCVAGQGTGHGLGRATLRSDQYGTVFTGVVCTLARRLATLQRPHDRAFARHYSLAAGRGQCCCTRLCPQMLLGWGQTILERRWIALAHRANHQKTRCALARAPLGVVAARWRWRCRVSPALDRKSVV